MKIHKVYKVPLYPTADQEQKMKGQAGAYRYTFNWGLGQKQAHYDWDRSNLTWYDLKKIFTQHKKSKTWLKEYDSHSLQYALQDVIRAYTNFFEGRAAFPKFKSRHKELPSWRITNGSASVRGNRFFIPKIGLVRFKDNRNIEGRLLNATISQDATGKWWASICMEQEVPDILITPVPDRIVGVDVGLSEFAVMSDGTRVEAQNFYRKSEKAIRKASRALSRKQRGSEGYKKAKKKLAKKHAKVANQRKHFLHNVSKQVVENNDAVILEDLKITNMLKNRHLAKSISDASWGEFRRQVEYKSHWSRKPFVKVNPRNTSRTCNACKNVIEHLDLGTRGWTCGFCGHIIDRDLNASENIRELGMMQLGVNVSYTHNMEG